MAALNRIVAAVALATYGLCGAYAQNAADEYQLNGDFARSVCGYVDGDDRIVVPEGVEAVPDYAFYEFGEVRSVVLPESVTVIGKSAFAWCESLQEVVLPSGLLDIGAHAFAYCAMLKGVELPPVLTHIGNNAFSRCTSLERISIPDSVTELESYAFSDCFSLSEIVMPANNSLLGELIFSGCCQLTRLVESSPVPPTFDCESYIFEPDERECYERCVLVVPEESYDAYASNPSWGRFMRIEKGFVNDR